MNASRPAPKPNVSDRHVGLPARIGAALTGLIGGVAGIAPHVLHHVGPIAGAALLTGVGGTAIFGVVGFASMIPFLLRLRRRFGTWTAPSVAVALFAVLFTISTLWIGPAIRGDSAETGVPSTDHPSHHSP